MTLQIELDQETEKRISAQANSLGMTLETYASKILREYAPYYATGTGVLRPGDIDSMTKDLTSGSEELPVLPPEANNREFYYEDRI